MLLNSPADTWRDDNVIITSKRNNDIIASRVRVENLTGLAGIVNATVYKTELIFTRLGHGKSVQIINIVYIYITLVQLQIDYPFLSFSIVQNSLSALKTWKATRERSGRVSPIIILKSRVIDPSHMLSTRTQDFIFIY